jgi:hypothetical protein
MHLVVSVASDTEIWERASWIATVAAATVAIIGALFAGAQLLDVRRASQASLLLDLDARFDSEGLRAARDLFSSLRQDIHTIVSTNNPHANDAAKRDLICAEWRQALADLRKNDTDSYIMLIGWLGFFETLGLMVKKRYISEQDAFDLFRGPLIDIGNSFRLHIEDRSKETGVSEGLFEHALSLSARASKA